MRAKFKPMIDRRGILGLAMASGLGSVVAPGLGGAQERPKVPRVAYLGSTSGPTPTAPSLVFQAFLDALRDLGYVDGQNIAIESRWANGQSEKLPLLAADLVREGVDVLCPVGAVTIRAAKAASASVPMVFALVVDPVAIGLVSSWHSPGANLTGFTSFDPNQARNQFAILKDAIPALQRVSLIIDGAIPDRVKLVEINAEAARTFGIETQSTEIRAPNPDIKSVFEAATAWGANAVLVVEHPATAVYRKAIGDAGLKSRMPTMFARDYVDAGGVFAYGTAFSEATRRIPLYVDRILKGAKPGDLPVERINEPGLIINLKVARQIGLAIPNSIAERASQVIE